MIIQRYLIRQVALTTLAVTSILTLIMLGGRLIKYFGMAAEGRLQISALLSVIGYRLADFLTLILPLGFFAGLMLVFGRLYVDHEMAVFNASGISRNRLSRLLWPLLVLVVLIEAVAVLQAGPWGARRASDLLTQQAMRSGFDAVQPGQFVSSGDYTFYADQRSADGRHLLNLFVHQQHADGSETLITASKASRRIDPRRKSSVIDLEDGQRYEFAATSLAHTRSRFQFYRLYLDDVQDAPDIDRYEIMTTSELWAQRQLPAVQAELGWRFSMPWVPVIAWLMAIPLAQVNPRQGRYIRLFPALMIFISLIIALLAIKTRVTREKIGAGAYAGVLLAYLLFGLWLNRPSGRAGQRG